MLRLTLLRKDERRELLFPDSVGGRQLAAQDAMRFKRAGWSCWLTVVQDSSPKPPSSVATDAIYDATTGWPLNLR